MMCCMLGLALGVHAQESAFLQQYREKVKAYNQDIKSAGYAVSIRQEAEKSAKADFLPSLSGNANASYTGNPLELYRELPSIETPLYFQGRDTKYGASVTLLQPVYSGGALKAGLEKSRKEKESALYEEKRVTNDVLYQADQYYWIRWPVRKWWRWLPASRNRWQPWWKWSGIVWRRSIPTVTTC